MSNTTIETIGNDNTPPFRDMWDFYESWPALRERVVPIRDDPRLRRDERVIVEWMIRVMDRVGPVDLDPYVGGPLGES